MKALKSRSRGSLGIKLMIVCALVVLMAIPAMFVSYVSFERSSRADDVTREVSARYGGSQLLTGPILVAPYFKASADGDLLESGEYVIFPEDGRAEFHDVKTEIRKRSLFKVPIYKASGTLSATFNPVDKSRHEKGRNIQWDQAQFLVGLSDGRGLSDDVYLVSDRGTKYKFEPVLHTGPSGYSDGAVYDVAYKNMGGISTRSSLTYLSVPAQSLMSETESFSVTARLKIGGATEFSVMPYAKSTQLSLKSNWASPGFTGGFAPIDREISANGFFAKWSVPYLARGILGAGEFHELDFHNQSGKAMSTRFVAEVSPYQTVNRALKYAVLFIGLVFMTFFLFEVMVGVRVHPAQYILIGLAQTIFYLLLLAFSEHVGFVLAYMIAAGAIVGLTGAYAGAVLGSRDYAIRAGGVFAVTYGLLFSLMRLQDFALLIGALASFGAIALIMYLTRDLDWYGGAQTEDAQLSFNTSPAK